MFEGTYCVDYVNNFHSEHIAFSQSNHPHRETMDNVMDVAKYINDKFDSITDEMFANNGIQFTNDLKREVTKRESISDEIFAEDKSRFSTEAHRDHIENLKSDAKRKVTSLITSHGTRTYAARLNDVYQRDWEYVVTDDSVYNNVCMELIEKASKPAGMALQLIKDEIEIIQKLEQRDVNLEYHIKTFDETAYDFTELDRYEELKPEVIAGNDLLIIKNRMWETPKSIIEAAILTTQLQFQTASDKIMEQNVLNETDEVVLGNKFLGEISIILAAFISTTSKEAEGLGDHITKNRKITEKLLRLVYTSFRVHYLKVVERFHCSSKTTYERFYALIFRLTRDRTANVS